MEQRRRRIIPIELEYKITSGVTLKIKQVQNFSGNVDTVSLGKYEGLKVYDALGESINKYMDEANRKLDNPRFLNFLREVQDFADGKYAINKYQDTVNFILDEDYVISFNTLDINRIRLYNTTRNKIIINRREILELFPDISEYWEYMRRTYGNYSNYKFNKGKAIFLFRVNNDDLDDIEIVPMNCDHKIKYKDFMGILKEVERIRIEDEGKGPIPMLKSVVVPDLSNQYDKTKFQNINQDDFVYRKEDLDKPHKSDKIEEVAPIQEEVKQEPIVESIQEEIKPEIIEEPVIVDKVEESKPVEDNRYFESHIVKEDIMIDGHDRKENKVIDNERPMSLRERLGLK